MMRPGITSRIVLLATLVAAIAVIVAALVSYPLVRSTAQATAADDLSRLAELTVTSLRVQGGAYVLPERVAAILRGEEVVAYIVTSGATDLPDGITPADVAKVTQGAPVTAVTTTAAGDMLVVGRPLERGVGVVLLQPAEAASNAGAVLLRLAIALAIGLAIAVVIAIVASRRIARPLRRAADAAERLGRGERGVVVTPQGPAEVAQVAESLNRLSTELAMSEGRQRDFLLSVSHELRTPLTAVRGYAEALADGVVPADDVERTGAVMSAETQRLDRLVTDLLDLARLGAVDFRITSVPVQLDTLAREAAAVWHDRCERESVAFWAEIPEQPVLVRADPMRLRQVLDNLAENALRVTPAGRQMVLAVRVEPPWGVLEVRDGGPGLQADDLPVAFEPGVLHERYRGIRQVGTGLGLALVGRLAAGMRGWARAGNAPEGGASFIVGMPLDEGIR